MDPATIDFYTRSARETGERYSKVPSIAARYFGFSFPPKGKILDVGCGGGRDLHALIEAGYDAIGVDASSSMLEEALKRHGRLKNRLVCDTLPELSLITDTFDGILCWATLMHVPSEFLFDTVFNLRRLLRPGGNLLISTPLERPGIDSESHRDAEHRLFNGVTPENFRFLFERIGFKLINRWDNDDSLGRPRHRWATQLFTLESYGSRSLDKIESILNRDKKDATYKPALFRALAEIATTSYHAAAWLPEGRVAIPIELIADKWLEYFWPIFESEIFIPQKRGEAPKCKKPVAFRAELNSLITSYRTVGGLCAFTVERRGEELSREVANLYKAVKRKICETIRSGPVYYSGGGGSQTFTYDSLSRCVLMHADLWTELSLMGNWISDATVLRWAELTSEISQGVVKPSQVIDHLLTVPIPEREIGIARQFYENLPEKVCVWTDRNLKTQFDIDHAIPFALWRNNDLWNLLPALSTVNNQKRDRLPSLKLLRKRKECIIHYWQLMRSSHVTRFDFEVSRLAGQEVIRAQNWETKVFAALTEAIEGTAVHRGVERWEPSNASFVFISEAGTTDKLSHEPSTSFLITNPPLEERFSTSFLFLMFLLLQEILAQSN